MSTPATDRGLLGVSAVLFAVSAMVTVAWCGSMSAMPGMEMPGGWTMSMAWMRMPGQSWSGAAATFVGMWAVMMVAMMLPSLVPMLSRYRQAVDARADASIGWLTTRVAMAYFAVWTLTGAMVFPFGIALAEWTMRVPAVSRLVPIATGVVVMLAGALQISAWKSRQLACCRAAPVSPMAAEAGTAWRHGIRLGLRCVYCCLGMTAILLVIGVMDLRAMALVTAAITAERLAPAGGRVARGIGVFTLAGSCALIAQATSSG